MKFRKLSAVFLLSCSLTLAACAVPGQPGSAPPGEIGFNKTTGGALIGAGVGGLVGSQFGGGSGKALATLFGVLAGGLVGSQIGASLDRADQLAVQRTTQTALETVPPNQTLPWRNPDNGHAGAVTPGRYYQTASGQYCREFEQTITIGGETQQGHGTACRQPDGSWRIVPQ